ncbi:NAD(P)-dependent alcohol dehydrogenase [Desulfovibrio cuneatus]|uniref:NAD(P)-dependent alcohol dehydrogenase n=1 Tax=Desulfovibrio cuneatus TaxID=159728 RepID=UPI00041B6D42|nr:NAD(P)-dependent alcohol dehydrogenase [Desulfovibrio cuneatus]
MKMLAAVLYEQGGQFVFEEVDLAEPKENEVLVKVVAVGVCHTDEGGRQWMIEPPVVLGHEGSGIVERVGAGVKNFQPGDHVVITVASCGTCNYCTKGMPFACPHMGALNIGGKMQDGTSRISKNGKEIKNFFGQSTFAQYAVVNATSLVKVDKTVDIAMLGPLGCGFQTGAGTVLGCLKAGPEDSLVIFGCGSLGLTGVMAAKIAGCKHIIAVGGTPDKLKLALELGATHTINRKEVADVPAEVTRICGRGASLAFETTGAPAMFTIALASLGALGKVALCGVGNKFTFDPMDLIIGSKTIVGSNEGNLSYHTFIPQMVEYYKQGKFPFDKLIKYYDFKDIEQAFQDSHKGLTVKPVLRLP